MARHVLRVLIGEEVGQRLGRERFEALDGLFDLVAARAHEVRVEGHAPNASTAARRTSGAMSRYSRIVRSMQSANLDFP